MRYPKYHSILHDFDLSIVLPFYKKLHDFEKIIPSNAPFFQRNGIEVIIVMDEPTETEGVIEVLKTYPLINWRLIVNRNLHVWRNPSRAINVGIKNSTKNYIMVCSPESKFHTDAIFRLRFMAEHYGRCFAVGKVFFSTYENRANSMLVNGLPYGSIMVKKTYLENAGAYSEFFDDWGGEDNNLRAKLEHIGLKKIYVDDAVLVHYEEQVEGFKKRAKQSTDLPDHIVQRSYYPSKVDFTNTNWGCDFDQVMYDYTDNKHSEFICRKYLEKFKKTEISKSAAFTKRFPVVALIQTHNEMANMPAVLAHLDSICDGIILLDDESTDGTYENATSEKLLIKVQQYRSGFNDLNNRNELLNIASFVKAKWLFFLDADERLMLWGNKLETICSMEFNAYCFYLIHLWDSEKTFRRDTPEQSPIGIPGILHRWRIFKHNGRMQIISDSKLHFQVSPYFSKPKIILPVLIVHHGMLQEDLRKRKYQNYLREDSIEQHIKYEYFLDKNIELSEVDSIAELPLRHL